MASAQQQAELTALNALILRRLSGQAIEEGQDGGDRWRGTSTEALIRIRNQLRAEINRASRGGMFRSYDAARPQ